MKKNVETSLILLNINGTNFLLESKSSLNKSIKNDIRILCKSAFEEDSSFNEYLEKEDKAIEDVSDFEIAGLFESIVKVELGIDLKFKNIDLELKIQE